MKIICITGFSGSGKSKATDMFVENLPNSAAVMGSLFLRHSAPLFKKEFEEIFEMTLDMEHPEDSLREGVNKSAAQHRAYMDVIGSYIENEINTAIKNAEENGCEYFIVDWIELPILEIWKKADYRIMIDAQDDVRTYHLANRRNGRSENAMKFYSERTSQIRKDTFREALVNAKGVDYLIFNEYDEHLKNEVEYLCQKIVMEKPLLLPLDPQ